MSVRWPLSALNGSSHVRSWASGLRRERSSRSRQSDGKVRPEADLRCDPATRVLPLCGDLGRPHSNALRAASFNNSESRLSGRERHVVGHYGLGEALEGEYAKLFGCDAAP